MPTLGGFTQTALLTFAGILDFEEDDEDDENDEILRELRAKQAELKSVCQYNALAAKRLYKLGKEELAKQELKRKLALCDSEVWTQQYYAE